MKRETIVRRIVSGSVQHALSAIRPRTVVIVAYVLRLNGGKHPLTFASQRIRQMEVP